MSTYRLECLNEHRKNEEIVNQSLHNMFSFTISKLVRENERHLFSLTTPKTTCNLVLKFYRKKHGYVSFEGSFIGLGSTLRKLELEEKFEYFTSYHKTDINNLFSIIPNSSNIIIHVNIDLEMAYELNHPKNVYRIKLEVEINDKKDMVIFIPRKKLFTYANISYYNNITKKHVRRGTNYFKMNLKKTNDIFVPFGMWKNHDDKEVLFHMYGAYDAINNNNNMFMSDVERMLLDFMEKNGISYDYLDEVDSQLINTTFFHMKRLH